MPIDLGRLDRALRAMTGAARPGLPWPLDNPLRRLGLPGARLLFTTPAGHGPACRWPGPHRCPRHRHD